MTSYPQTLLVVGLVSVSATALPIRCFADCNQPMSTVEESQCAQEQADKAAQKMKMSLNRVLVDVEKIIESENAVNMRQQVRESQIIWEKWKESQCKLEADVTMGSAGAYVIYQCRERLIIERTKSLDDIAQQIESLL